VRAVVLRVVSGNSAQGLSRDPIVYLHSALLPSWNLVLVPSLLPEMWSRFYLSFLDSGSRSYSCRRSPADTISMCGNCVSHYITLHYINVASGLGGGC
jgi:hypothetical protein